MWQRCRYRAGSIYVAEEFRSCGCRGLVASDVVSPDWSVIRWVLDPTESLVVLAEIGAGWACKGTVVGVVGKLPFRYCDLWLSFSSWVVFSFVQSLPRLEVAELFGVS